MTTLLDNEAIFYDEATDVYRLNQLLDDLTDKRFISVNVFIDAVRAAMGLHGITLPMLDPEHADKTGSDMYAPMTDGLWIFNVLNSADLNAESDVYLYMIADQDDDGVWECYAQLVNGKELEELLSTDPLDYEFPELVGDVAGETEWLAQQRHIGNHDVDEAPPQG